MPLSTWTFLKNSSDIVGFSCGAVWRAASATPRSHTAPSVATAGSTRDLGVMQRLLRFDSRRWICEQLVVQRRLARRTLHFPDIEIRRLQAQRQNQRRPRLRVVLRVVHDDGQHNMVAIRALVFL